MVLRTLSLIAFACPLCAQPCATCHAGIAATYARTGMARSFYRPQPAQSEPFYGTLLERSGQRAAALREYQEALRLSPDFDVARRNGARLAR